MSNNARRNAYRIESRNKFFEAIRGISQYEFDPGITVSLISEVDLTEVERVRELAGEHRPSYTAFVVKAVALTLTEFPYANRRPFRRFWLPFSAPRLQAFQCVDIAVASERDLPDAAAASFADVLRDADKLSLVEITTWLRGLASADTGSNKQWHDFHWAVTKLPRLLSTLVFRLPCLFPSLWVKWRGGAAFISSPAKYGVDTIVGTWNCPLGVSFGLVKLRPVVRDGEIVARPTFNLLLNFDRTVMAGAQAARFFKRIIDYLENAEKEMAAFLPRDLSKSATCCQS
jgi:pyruvate/2-oxoglutarate dehydrogenase complex dihydrolipoamide acyltransferase (E2) component